MEPSYKPRGWVDRNKVTILIVLPMIIISNLGTYIITRLKTQVNLEAKLSNVSDGFKEIKGGKLTNTVLYDAGIEESIMELGRDQIFKASPGKSFLYIKTSHKISRVSHDSIEKKLQSFRYITKVFVADYGVAVEKISSRNEELREKDKILFPWERVFRETKPLLEQAVFE